jgi:hypothetical protein
VKPYDAPGQRILALVEVAEAASTLMACPQCAAALQESFENQNGHAWALRDALARLDEKEGER